MNCRNRAFNVNEWQLTLCAVHYMFLEPDNLADYIKRVGHFFSLAVVHVSRCFFNLPTLNTLLHDFPILFLAHLDKSTTW